MAFFACARTLAHRFLAAFAIFALPASERTRFFIPDNSRPAEFPNAFPAARTPSNCFCNLPNCFSSFRSSRLIAARMFIESSARNLSQDGDNAPDVPWKQSNWVAPQTCLVTRHVPYYFFSCPVTALNQWPANQKGLGDRA